MTASTLHRTDNITFVLTASIKTDNAFLLGYYCDSIGFSPRRFEVMQVLVFKVWKSSKEHSRREH